jgi:16S rRNA (uracil1498-N3)-methyltransferase
MTSAKKHPRFYAPELGSEVSLPSDQAHHALGVLRLGVGESVALFDGRGASADGRIIRIGRGEVVVAAGEVSHEPAPRPRVHLAFAVPKGKRLDWLLEKATELAAASLQPIVFERSVAGGAELTEAKRRRWLGHCISAAKQCGLNRLPELHDVTALSDFLTAGKPATNSIRLLGDADIDSTPLADALKAAGTLEDVTVLVGPEGGPEAAERRQIVAAGFVPARLGATTLRIETAAVALLAAIRAVTDSGETS